MARTLEIDQSLVTLPEKPAIPKPPVTYRQDDKYKVKVEFAMNACYAKVERIKDILAKMND